MNVKKRNKDYKTQILKRKNAEIESLKKQISEMELDDSVKKELSKTIEKLKKKSNELDKIEKELIEMRSAMNKIVYHKRWKIIKLLLK